MKYEGMIPENQLMIRLSNCVLDQNSINEIINISKEVTDWDYFIEQASNNYLIQLFTIHFTNTEIKNVIPPFVQANAVKVYQKLLAENIRLFYLFNEIAYSSNLKGVRLIPLKGIYLAEKIYQDYGLRHISDIDILVESHDLDKMVKILIDLSWKLEKTPQTSSYISSKILTAHPFTLTKNNHFIEIHNRIHSGGQSYEIDTNRYIKNTISTDFGINKVYTLQLNDLIQHLCIHIHKHLFFGRLKISSFCDLREIFRKQENKIDWDKFLSTSKEYNCTNEVCSVLYLLKKYWQVDFLEDILPKEIEITSTEAEERFLYFLNGDYQKLDKTSKTNELNNLAYLKKQNGTINKFRYLLNDVFPTTAYIKYRYQLKADWMVYPFYIVRWYKGISKTLGYFLAKRNGTKEK